MNLSKYTRTYHLPWSKGIQSDDKMIKTLSHFEGEEIVVLEKLDGENTSLYSIHDGGHQHARSMSSRMNWTQSWIAKMHSILTHHIPKNMKFIGENMFAKHSIRYENLHSYFYLFAIWEQQGNDLISLSFDDILLYAELLDLATPTVLYRGVFDEKKLIEIAKSLDSNTVEGYVVRKVGSFLVSDTQKNIAKYVRGNHVQPDSEHWLKNAKQNGDLIQPIKPYYMG